MSLDNSSVYDLANTLSRGYGFDEVQPIDFYREIFPEGELQKKGELKRDLKYNGIAVELVSKSKVKRYTVTDDLEIISDLLDSPNFVVISPISYIGKERSSKNARCLYALCIEIDNLKVKDNEQVGLRDLLFQMENKLIPTPTFIVCSGHGLHLYYQFEHPLFLFPNTIERLQNYKRWFTRKIWNKYTTNSYEERDIQYESLFQGFRLVGGVTKRGDERTVCFRTGTKVSIDYMNSFLPNEPLSKGERDVNFWEGLFLLNTYKYNSVHKLADAKKLYPEWYARRIVNKSKKSRWIDKPDLYYWWLREISNYAKEGHRYYCLMMLVIYAIKCNISEDQLKEDCYSMLLPFEELTKEGSSNHFTKKDIDDALKCFKNSDLVTYPINSIINRTGIDIKKNKRNGRKRAEHVKLMNFIRDELMNKKNWREGNGRKKGSIKDRESARCSKIILNWKEKNPNGTKKQCKDETGLTYPTIRKWWNEE